MASSSLVLHSGAQPVTIEELAEYKAPPPEGRWHPISHSRVLSVVSECLHDAGYGIARQQLGVMKDGARFFGTMDLKDSLADGVSLAIGVRNSVDKTFPLGFIAGSRVFVCDNLAFSSELLVKRKHTLYGERDFSRRIFEAVARLATFKGQEVERINRLKERELTHDQADATILRAYERGILGARELPKVIQEWREPTYEELDEHTAWGLFNAFTVVLRERSEKQPQSHAVATMRLHALLDPSRN